MDNNVSVHSIIIIKKGNKFLNYFEPSWNMYLFPNMKGNNIDDVIDMYNTDNVTLLFDKVHEKFSVKHGINRTYHHFFYEVDTEIEGEYFTLDELLELPHVRENNEDVISYIRDYYNCKSLKK